MLHDGTPIGTVTVTGAGSSLNIGPGGGFNIGSFGTGTLTITNGGMVVNNTAFTANIAAFKAGDKMMGSLLDILA